MTDIQSSPGQSIRFSSSITLRQKEYKGLKKPIARMDSWGFSKRKTFRVDVNANAPRLARVSTVSLRTHALM